MLLAACASLRTAGQGCGAWSGGAVQAWRLVQQACVLRQAHTRQDAGSSTGSQTATTDSDTASGPQEGSETPSTAKTGPEASSGNRMVHMQQQRTAPGLQQRPPDSGSLSGVAGAAVGGLEGAATPAALHSSTLADQGPTLHKPYSHLVWRYQNIKVQRSITTACALCTDIEAVQFAHGSCSVQVSFVSHPADWDIKGYVQHHPAMQQLQQVRQWVAAQASRSAAGNTTQFLEPVEAIFTNRTQGKLQLTDLPHQSIRQSLACGAPHAVVLKERLLSSEGPQFLLHIMPVLHEAGKQRANKLALKISRAGEGPGLQIFPGSVPEVFQVGNICSDGSGKGAYYIPRVLICSQLPADTTYPLEMTLTLMDSPGQQGQSSQQLGQWQVKAYRDGSSVVLGGSRILAKYVGYSVAKASLLHDPTQGVKLTLTLADTAGQP